MGRKHEKEQRRRFRNRRLAVAFMIISFLIVLLGPIAYVWFTSRDVRVTPEAIDTLEPRPVIIVFGAGVWPDGTPTPYLKNRLDTAKQAHQAGRATKILVSGDNSTEHYNEPLAMRNYLIKNGVPEQAVVLDYGGLNTYDTCYRAKEIFGVKRAYLTTQAYHLPRAVMTCRVIGIESIGIESVRQGRDFTASYLLREFISMYKAGGELLLRPEPLIMGKPEPISVVE